jgi:ubiquinone/menaquinone biosynthesis C-methylase UbiE
MAEQYGQDEIRRFWAEQAAAHGREPDASWSDRRVIEMEIDHIAGLLADGDRVLDAGCANGFSAFEYARRRNVTIHGIDYIPQMIDRAKARLAEADAAVRRRMSFDVGDITSLDAQDASFEKLVVTRVLINLGDWSRQEAALHECLRVVRHGGLLLLSEATVQGWEKLNAFRAEWGLDAIPTPAFNTYLDEELVIQSASRSAELVELRNFASTYYVGTRVLKPLLAEALGGRVDVADPLMHWNRFFASLPAGGDYGTQKLFVFRRR